ncbi:MAG: hypothetical protein IPH86_11650 [bacterium]|jgi:hypothetical protein|nr:hypothetical protein [bacterium]MBK7045970.1 hypothetical protein [bacterium]MBK7189309.1 hypothetical protein [bacterium]MBK7671604.1 hypothetical protein [bacterium]MBK7770664.1 hypothetical protein [bacterium]
MELPRTTGIDLPPPGESELLGRLLSLYEEEARVYTRVLELSQRQGEAVRQGAPFSEIRRLLEQKRGCLDLIARLERGEVGSKREWESRRAAMSPSGRARLRAALDRVGGLIEGIIACEEANDRELFAATGVS